MHKRTLQLQSLLGDSPLMLLPDPWLKQRGVEVWVKRDDLLHPVISGNKWRKLKYCLDRAFKESSPMWLSMGGAFSNHLHALAFLGKEAGVATRAFVRGQADIQLNPTLKDIQDWGMEIHFVTRTQYRALRDQIGYQKIPGFEQGQFWIPEGGAVKEALQGVAEIADEINMQYDVLCVACGTGTTLAGLRASLPDRVQLEGFSALKDKGFFTRDVENLIALSGCENPGNWFIQRDYHFGGFAKTTAQLMDFMGHFEQINQIPLEPVYTAKLFYGIYDLIQRHYFKSGQRLIALHTGGLQGNRGFQRCSEY